MGRRSSSQFLFGAVLVLAALAAGSGGCSQQDEGERCDAQNGNVDDCADGLVCTPCATLRTLDVDRCCPPAGTKNNDPRCDTLQGAMGTCITTPGEGEGGAAGQTGQGATSSGGNAGEPGAAGAVSGGAGGEPASSGAGGEVATSGAGGMGSAGESGAPSASGAAGVSAAGTGGV